ncbi:outer membrane beta-barrel protein [Sphingomonas naphthae]|uniref:Outer membrane beta-barrel protein n=1 Tax=Sphingomonas naphthae TaxID=1813468 RepID=A0ABY7TR36_9SPHN|nr:outer membrane beta-barrel protein [Sphingomonas naphthae]WCT75102.1 outer membrane beta-barrel protein [Sphingomonas naphthae]
MHILLLVPAAAAAAFLAAAPASAQGVRAEIHGGWDRVSGGGHDDGIVYGVGLGYDHAIGRKLTLGIEANADESSVKECQSAGTVRACAKAGRDLSVAARLGHKVSETGTLYALAGYTNARVTGSLIAGIVPTATRFSDTLDGVRVGVGYEQAISGKLYAKAEYRYSNYEGGTERHQLLTGIGVRF